MVVTARSRSFVTVLVLLATISCARGIAWAEADHFKGYKSKDLNEVAPPANPYTLTSPSGSETCELKKVLFHLVPSENGGADDPRGGPAGEFVCYKAKCTGPTPPGADRDSQFGALVLRTKKAAKLVCLPVGTPSICGNNVREGAETCDGTDASACPSDCLTDCTCAPTCVPPAGGLAACNAYQPGADCYECCNESNPSCFNECGAAASAACASAAGNEQCASAANAAGCAAECCAVIGPAVCGNNAREGSEVCDGTDAAACPAECLPDCTCAPACVTTGGAATACNAYLAANPCQECCNEHIPSCYAECGAAAAALCSSGVANDACSAAANAAACASECCN